MKQSQMNSLFKKYPVPMAIIVLLAIVAFVVVPQIQDALTPATATPLPNAASVTPGSATLMPGAVTLAPATGSLPAWLTVYFTDPNPPDNLGHGIDQYVQPVLDAAAQTIDVTSFDLNLPNLVNALANASKRGVKVRVVYDGTNGSLDVNNAASGNKPFDAIQTLKNANVGLVNGGRAA